MGCWFSRVFLKAFTQILNILRNYGWTILTTVAFVGICHTSCLPKFGHQRLNCPSIRCIAPAKISPALPLCQKNWFCGKVRLGDFYLLLRSIASCSFRNGVKRISQACCLHNLKNMEKNCKIQLWDEKQNRVLFLNHPVFPKRPFERSCLNIKHFGWISFR